MSAINALLKPDFSAKLSQNEKDLVKISLAQQSMRNTEEEAVVSKSLEAYLSLVDASKVCDSEFGVLE